MRRPRCLMSLQYDWLDMVLAFVVGAGWGAMIGAGIVEFWSGK